MKCNQYQELLMRYYDHDLNDTERELLYQHLNNCQGCHNLFEDLHRILTPLEAASLVEPAPGLEKMVLERIKALPMDVWEPSPKTSLKTSPDEESGLTKMIYGLPATSLVLLLLAIYLTLQNTGLSGFLLQSRQYFSFLSEVALNWQIIYQVIAGVFNQAILSILREIQNICLAAILFGIVLTVRFTAIKLANPKMDLH